MAFTLQERSDGLVFKIHVQPRSSKNKIVGLYGDTLKVMLTAPPVDNAANKACCEFLAKALRVKKTSVKIQSGHTTRDKRVMVKCNQNSAERKPIRTAILEWAEK